MNPIHLTDNLVVLAYDECTEPRNVTGYPHELLMAWTNKSYATVQRAIKKAYVHDLIDKKSSYRDGWLTDAGKQLLLDTLRSYGK